MSSNSKIEWTHHTFNPVRGCTKISPGCANCYAETTSKRNPKVLGQWGPNAPRALAAESAWGEPYHWNQAALAAGEHHRVFCASLADWLEDRWPLESLARLLQTIHDTPELDWLLLTKRPESWASRIDTVMLSAEELGIEARTALSLAKWLDGYPPQNVWIGTSIENQEWAYRRVPDLLKIPARVRFLSVEPMLEAINIEWAFRWTDTIKIPAVDWVICGGESGKKARPFDLAFAWNLLDQCRTAQVPFFMKQLGSNAWAAGMRLDIKHPKGGDPEEWPADLQIREFPTTSP